MRIKYIAEKFVALDNRSGCYMRSEWNSTTQTQVLRWSDGGDLIAEIFDYKNSKNYRLRLHPKPRYCGKTSHNNRVYEVLRAIQCPEGSQNWDIFRYTSHIQYQLKIHDRKLSASYNLEDRPLEFALVEGKLTLDYLQLERGAFPDEAPAPVIDANSNLQTIDSKLTAILAGAN